MKKYSVKLVTYLFFSFILLIIIFSFSNFSKKEFIILLKDKNFVRAIIFGLKTSLLATLLSAIFAIPAGFYLARNKRLFDKIIDSLFEIPIIIPPLIVGVLLLNFFNSQIIKSFYNFIFTVEGATIAQFLTSFPYTLKASKNSFELIPTIYEEIAMTLGASPLKSFIDTTFKLSINGIISGLILSWVRSFGEFGATLLVAGGIAGKTENLSIYIYKNMIEGEFNKGITASLVTIFLAVIIISLLKIFIIEKQ